MANPSAFRRCSAATMSLSRPKQKRLQNFEGAPRGPMEELVNSEKPFFLKPVKITTNNRRLEVLPGMYHYKVQVNPIARNVVALELVEYSIPRTLAPPFLFRNHFILGLFHTTSALPSKTFDIFLPAEYLVYDVPTEPAISYTSVLTRLLNEAIINDSTYGSIVQFVTIPNPQRKTSVGLLTLTEESGLADGSVGFQFIFQDPLLPLDDVPWQLMGFGQVNYESTLVSTIALYPPLQLLASNNEVDLNPWRTVDVYVREISSEVPVARLFSNSEEYTTVQNDTSYPTRFLPQMLRKLEELTIDVVIGGTEYPSDLAEHDFTFLAYVVHQEHEIGDYVKTGFRMGGAPANALIR